MLGLAGAMFRQKLSSESADVVLALMALVSGVNNSFEQLATDNVLLFFYELATVLAVGFLVSCWRWFWIITAIPVTIFAGVAWLMGFPEHTHHFAIGLTVSFGISATSFSTRLKSGLQVLSLRHAEEKKTQELAYQRDAAEEANRSKSRFLANMSHELRTPLNAIIGFSELVQEDLNPAVNKQQIEDLSKVTGSAKHLLSLIDEILDLSKIEAGKLKLEMMAVNLPALIEDLERTGHLLAKKERVEFLVSTSNETKNITSDPTRLRQCLFNLISNACKFSGGKDVTLSVQDARIQGQSGVLFTVTDEGIGMSPEQLAQVRAPFAQADSSTTRKYGGTGLGLSITIQLAEQMGGRLDLQSEVDVGTTSQFWVPREPLPETAPEKG